LKAIRRNKTFTDGEEDLIKQMISTWEDGNIPSSISKEVLKEIKGIVDPVRIFYIIRDLLPEKYLEKRHGKKRTNLSGDTEIILSSYLQKGEV
ncbi:MAG TPA: hypothetical protein GX727_07465, partial [Clostridium sp.]|nr:hypothetical protein [Clostridium sp.]